MLPAGRLAGPMSSPGSSELHRAFDQIASDAKSRGVGWGEWLSLAVGAVGDGRVEAAIMLTAAPDPVRRRRRW